MEFELDKHEVFRTVVPGFIFLFVLFSFYLFANNFVVNMNDNISSFLTVMALAITLPIGFLIYHIYRAFHVCFGEQREWESFEAEKIEEATGKDILKKRDKKSKVKLLSWLLEVVLHEKDNEPIKDRGYALISRIHSSGSAIVAIFAGIIFALPYFLFIKAKTVCIFWPLILGWIFAVGCLFVARRNTIEGHRNMMELFVHSHIDSIAEMLKKFKEN